MREAVHPVKIGHLPHRHSLAFCRLRSSPPRLSAAPPLSLLCRGNGVASRPPVGSHTLKSGTKGLLDSPEGRSVSPLGRTAGGQDSGPHVGDEPTFFAALRTVGDSTPPYGRLTWRIKGGAARGVSSPNRLCSDEALHEGGGRRKEGGVGMKGKYAPLACA